MSERIVVHRGTYHDSAYLMQVARRIQERPGVDEAVVLMGTPMNRDLLLQAGFNEDALMDVGPMDLVVALRGDTLEGVGDALDELLAGGSDTSEDRARAPGLRSLREAAAARPEAAVVSIAVPGEYAAHVAHTALDGGRHVFLFSDNVALDDEIALKQRGKDQGLLVMGPDCGTSILAGVRFGFANRVSPGPVGLVGPSGSGIQEVSCILANAGVGVSHAIGTGGRDMSDAVGGATTEMALSLLADDEDTGVIVLVAKKPGKAVAERFDELLGSLGKPVVVRYLGCEPRVGGETVRYVSTLDEAAAQAADRLGGRVPFGADLDSEARTILAGRERVGGRLVGLFGGGSLAAEAGIILERFGVASTVVDGPLGDNQVGADAPNIILDVGDDHYTRGRPHPMVDQSARLDLIEAVGRDPSVGLILMDVVLGDGAHPNPAPELAAAVRSLGNGAPEVVCSVSGTQADPQGMARQRGALVAAGIHVQPTAARAAQLAATLLAGGGRP